MKTNIIAITGLSGTGKSVIARRVANNLNIPFIITHTTRPIRPNEEDKTDYYFIDDSEYKELDKKNQLILKEEFKVAGGFTWRYALNKQSIEGKQRVITVLSPKGVKELKELGYNVLSLYIHVDEDIRLNRIAKRKDNQSIEEIKRRSKEDLEKFKTHIPDYSIDNNRTIKESIEEIMDVIIEEMVNNNI